MFMGKNLTNIRILNDLSRNQLAVKIGVTEQAVWQYENGYMSPKLEVVNKLKTIFRVKSIYFYKADLLNEEDMNNIHVENIAYRSETINSLTKSLSESMHVRFIDAFIKKIETKINYPKNNLVELRNETILFLEKNDDMAREAQINHVAELARKKLGLHASNNQNLLFYLEKAGAFVFEKEIGDTIDAYSLWSEDERPYIMLGSIKKSAVRRNFDLAHELGHLLLHYKVEFTMQDKKGYKDLEAEANNFASAFLLPEEQFRRDCSGIVKKSNPDAYVDLKGKWLVSLQALAMRAFKLNIINYQQYRYFYMSINKKDYKVIEPLDKEIPINHPRKIKSILQLLFENGLYTVTEIEEEFKVDLSFLSFLTGIEIEFFERHQQSEKRSFSVTDLNFKAK